MENFLRGYFSSAPQESAAERESILTEVEDAVLEAMDSGRPVELSPQPKHIRRKQHIYVERSGLSSESIGVEPLRRVRIKPR